MEFVKIYEGAIPNAGLTLERKVPIAPLVDQARSERVRDSLRALLKYDRLNFWDFGVRATSNISVGDSVKIICGRSCYTGLIVSRIEDPTGELGDLLGWTRQFKAPWKNVCALVVQSCQPVNASEIAEVRKHARMVQPNFYSRPAFAVKPEVLIEGRVVELTLTSFERDPTARKACLEHFGACCQVCGIDFGETYGELGRGFIHVHHKTPLAQVREAHTVDPVRDLVPVCPNCHAMLHISQGDPLSVEQLRELISGSRTVL